MACTKNFEEINTNPNALSEVKAYNLFEPILYGMGYQQQTLCQYYNNEIVQVTGFTNGQTQHIKEYIISTGNWQTIWDNYARYGSDCANLVSTAENDGDDYYKALGLILKVYNLCNLSDLFGDIPYKEAYKYEKTPAFESQVDVAENMIADLDTATLILSKKPEISKSGYDLMYGDSYNKWIKLANSMKLRILCRFSGISDSYWDRIQAIVSNPAAYPVMESNDDNANVPFQTVDPYMSYWGQAKVTASSFNSYRLTENMINNMVLFDDNGLATYVDPRLPVYGKQRNNAWKGTVSGCNPSENSAVDEGTSYLNYDLICRSDFPAFLFDYSEVLFIEAEGVEKGKITIAGQTAKSLYEAAVRANMEKWQELGASAPTPIKLRSSDITAFLSSKIGSYDYAAAKDGSSIYGGTEELILTQKYISMLFCGFEQFSEWRRTEYPILTIGDGTSPNDYELPTRLGYPNYTLTSNAKNVAVALERMGGENNMHTALDWSYKKLSEGQHRNPYVAK